MPYFWPALPYFTPPLFCFLEILVLLPAWPLSLAVKKEGMGNLEADFNLSESSKTSGLSRHAAWGHWMSLGPGRGFNLCCRWNSSILSSEFIWWLVGWEVKGSMFHIVPVNVVYKQFNDAVIQFLLLMLVSWKFNIKIVILFHVASLHPGQRR